MSELEIIQAETRDLSAEKLLQYISDRYAKRVAFASSLGIEDQVITDMLCRLESKPTIFTLDTGRLPEETYDLIEATNNRYGIRIKVMFPEAKDVENLVEADGLKGFRQTIEARKRCCHVRKVLPLQRALNGLDAWITGLRREQAQTRGDLLRVGWDAGNELIKINPLADWSTERVWQYVREYHVPYNALHDRGYPSIGCAPCTRAVEEGQDIRAGRWWWEQPQQKECGLHVIDGQLVRHRQGVD